MCLLITFFFWSWVMNTKIGKLSLFSVLIFVFSCFHFGVSWFVVPNLFLLAFFGFRKYWLSAPYKLSADSQEEDYEALKDFIEIAGGYYPDFDTWDYPKGHFDETCMDAVPLSLYIITLSSSFEDAIRLAIYHGDDGDTCEKVHQKIENDKNDFDKND